MTSKRGISEPFALRSREQGLRGVGEELTLRPDPGSWSEACQALLFALWGVALSEPKLMAFKMCFASFILFETTSDHEGEGYVLQ